MAPCVGATYSCLLVDLWREVRERSSAADLFGEKHRFRIGAWRSILVLLVGCAHYRRL